MEVILHNYGGGIGCGTGWIVTPTLYESSSSHGYELWDIPNIGLSHWIFDSGWKNAQVLRDRLVELGGILLEEHHKLGRPGSDFNSPSRLRYDGGSIEGLCK
jgi:hypothetical protein